MLTDLKFAITDVETTGLFAGHHDRIVEIAIVRLDSGGRILDEYVTLVNPERDIGATHIHGIRAGDVRHAPVFREIAGDVVSRLSGAVFVAHNAHFDLRFVRAELARIDVAVPDIPYLCTMQLARRADPDIPSRRLGSLCGYFGIPFERAHAAHQDARATAALMNACAARLGAGGALSRPDLGIRGQLPPPEFLPKIPASGKSYVRSQAAQERAAATSYIARLVAKLPSANEGNEELGDYLALLDRVLEDRRVTADEAGALLSLSLEAGLSRDQVRSANLMYVRDLIRVAWDDSVITDAEQRDLDEVHELLGIKDSEYARLLAEVQADSRPDRSAASWTTLNACELHGKTICFTGVFRCRIHGRVALRSDAERIAGEHGLEVKRSCTKRLDYLVAADPDSMSGKAKKARQYGVRILAEPVFWRMMGVDVE
jgi:DNA polymerase-3 subunit epsilon